MTHRGAMRRMFPGANTSRGFVSFFEYIAPPGGYTFVLKGGPGAGKSTFMKRTAAELRSFGVDIEYHHCSADPASVDAIAFPGLGLAVVDGTAPHPVEPAPYEVGGEIVDLGRFCRRDAVRVQRSRIEELGRRARAAFGEAYRRLRAARTVRDAWADANRGRRDPTGRQETARLLEALFTGAPAAEGPSLPVTDGPSAPTSEGPPTGERPPKPPGGHRAGPRPEALGLWPAGFRRRLFASAITPEGPRHHLDAIIGPMPRRFVVTGDPGAGRADMLETVARHALARGLFVETYQCPLDTNRTDHVVIPALGAAVVSSVPPPASAAIPPSHPDDASVPAPVAALFDLNRFIVPHKEASRTAAAEFWRLFHRAVDALAEAKAAHMELEACYVPHMDFDGVEQLRRDVQNRLLQIGGIAARRP